MATKKNKTDNSHLRVYDKQITVEYLKKKKVFKVEIPMKLVVEIPGLITTSKT